MQLSKVDLVCYPKIILKSVKNPVKFKNRKKEK